MDCRSGAPECVHLDPGLLPPLHLIWLDSAAKESGKVGAVTWVSSSKRVPDARWSGNVYECCPCAWLRARPSRFYEQ